MSADGVTDLITPDSLGVYPGLSPDLNYEFVLENHPVGLAFNAVNHQPTVLRQFAGLLEQVGAALQHHRHPLATGLVNDRLGHQSLADAPELVETDIGLAILASDDALDRHPLDQACIGGLLRSKPMHKVERFFMGRAVSQRHQRVQGGNRLTAERRRHVLRLID